VLGESRAATTLATFSSHASVRLIRSAKYLVASTSVGAQQLANAACLSRPFQRQSAANRGASHGATLRSDAARSSLDIDDQGGGAAVRMALHRR
jgi:hypothetical protein